MALSPQQVAEIWQQQWRLARPFVEEMGSGARVQRNKKGALPELWPGYSRAWEQREGLAPHIEYGVFPDRLFAERAPNQSAEEFDYVRKNYKQITLPVWLVYENTIGRALHVGNWSAQWIEDEDTAMVREHVEGGIKEWGSVESFMRRMLVRLKTLDPMGVVYVLPEEIPVMETEDGTLVSDPDAPVRPDLKYSQSNDVWGFEYDSWYLLRLNESSSVQYGNKSVEGVLCWLVDDTNVWRIEQVGRRNDWKFEISLEFSHGVGEPPCIHLGGVPSVVDGHVAFESPYLAAKEVLDIALTDAQWLQVSKVKCVYPHVVMVGDSCDFYDTAHGVQCFEGKLQWTEGETLRISTCPRCNGTGKKRRLSPAGELLINPASNADGLGASDGVNATNALQFVSPGTDTVEFLRKDIEYHLQLARAIVHIDGEGPMKGGDAKTATEAGLNNRAKDAFVKPIADQILWVYEFCVRTMGRMMVGPEWNGFALRKPTQYDLRTEADRVAEIERARDTGLPPAIIDEMEGDLISARYSNDTAMLEAMEAIQRADRIARMPKETIATESAAGRVAPWEILLHYAALDLYRFLDETVPEFSQLDVWGRVAALHAEAKRRAAENTTSTPAREPATPPVLDRLAQIVQR